MARSAKKGPFVDPNIMKKIERMKASGGKSPIKTWSRACEIAPEMVGYTFSVHTGKDFVDVFVTEEMVGHRLGEFAPTRKFVKHGGKIQKALEAGAPAGTAPAAAAPAKK